MREPRVPEWPANTGEIVERVAARLKANLDAMGPEAEAAFWAAMPWPFYPGAPRERGELKVCADCGGWFRWLGTVCDPCLRKRVSKNP